MKAKKRSDKKDVRKAYNKGGGMSAEIELIRE